MKTYFRKGDVILMEKVLYEFDKCIIDEGNNKIKCWIVEKESGSLKLFDLNQLSERAELYKMPNSDFVLNQKVWVPKYTNFGIIKQVCFQDFFKVELEIKKTLFSLKKRKIVFLQDRELRPIKTGTWYPVFLLIFILKLVILLV